MPYRTTAHCHPPSADVHIPPTNFRPTAPPLSHTHSVLSVAQRTCADPCAHVLVSPLPSAPMPSPRSPCTPVPLFTLPQKPLLPFHATKAVGPPVPHMPYLILAPMLQPSVHRAVCGRVPCRTDPPLCGCQGRCMDLKRVRSGIKGRCGLESRQVTAMPHLLATTNQTNMDNSESLRDQLGYRDTEAWRS